MTCQIQCSLGISNASPITQLTNKACQIQCTLFYLAIPMQAYVNSNADLLSTLCHLSNPKKTQVLDLISLEQ